MTTDTEANLNEALDWLQKTGGAIQDFASEQAPIYCKEVVAWEFWVGAFFAGFGVLLICIGCVAAVKFARWLAEIGEEPQTFLAFAVALASLVAGPALLLHNAPQAIKAVVSPRLVIVEHLNKLRK